MSKELSLPTPHDPVSRVSPLDELAPGQYWRCIKAIKHRADDDRDTIAKGCVLLVKEIRRVDGAVHTIILATHPSAPRPGEHRILERDFRTHFEIAFDANEVRAAEIAEVEKTIETIRAKLVSGPPQGPIAAKALASPDKAANALIAPGRAVEARQFASQEIARAEEAAKWIKETADSLTDATQLLARFHAERANAALAQVDGTLKYANYLKQGVVNLGLYAGDGVEVEQLCDGDEAAAEEKLTLFQRKLYMDEEYLVHVETGGADWKDLSDFAASLQADERLLNRILPAPRAVVVMAFRRNDKHYLSGTSHAEIFYNEVLNQPNRASFLLVRNGRKVWRVFSEITTDLSSRLFPTTDESEKPFRGWDGETIGLDNVRFTDALEKHRAMQLHYKRLLILLWGLNDRLGLFGTFYDPSRYAGFMSLAFQQEAFRFVYDDERLLPTGRVRFDAWWKAMNGFAQSGSRILCLWKDLMTPESAPSCVRDNGSRDWRANYTVRYKPANAFDVCIARREGSDIVVDIEVSGDSWSSGSLRERSFKAQVNLSAFKKSHGDGGWLCLDAARREDLAWYLDSRTERIDYLSYVPAFAAALRTVEADEMKAAPLLEEVRAALVAGGVAEPGASLDQAVATALRQWRAAQRGRQAPAPAEADFAAAREAVMNQAYILLGRDTIPTDTIAEAVQALGREPLRLVSAGTSTLAVYASPTAAERDDRVVPYPWVQRLRVDRRKNGVKLVPGAWSTLPKAHAGEEVLKEWPEAKPWIDRALPGGLDKRRYEALLAEVSQWETTYDRFFGTPSATELNDEIARFSRLIGRISKKFVLQPVVVIPVALAVRKEVRDGRRPLRVLALRKDLSDILYRHADEAGRARIEDVYRRMYLNATNALKHLRRDAKTPPQLAAFTPENLAVARVEEPCFFNPGLAHSVADLKGSLEATWNKMKADLQYDWSLCLTAAGLERVFAKS